MSNVNPNSRAPFVTSDGRLTKYGIDTIREIQLAINLQDGTSDLDDIVSGDTLIGQVNAQAKQLEIDIEAIMTDTASAILMARVRELESRLSDLEAMIDFPVTAHLTNRINQLEDQL
jgi:hypothetical protein